MEWKKFIYLPATIPDEYNEVIEKKKKKLKGLVQL